MKKPKGKAKSEIIESNLFSFLLDIKTTGQIIKIIVTKTVSKDKL